MHRALLVVLLCPAVASADIRLDTSPIPDLFALEAAFHLDRGEDWDSRSHAGLIGTVGLGYGRFDGEDTGTFVSAIAAGKYTDNWLVLASSELVTANDEVWRGHHFALVEAHSEEDAIDDLGGAVALQATLDHGEARALAPIYLGQGERTTIETAASGLLRLGHDKKDEVFVAELLGKAGATSWDSPLLDGAFRRSIGLGVGVAPGDGELPRGAIDLLRGRVEHVSITRPIIAAGAPAIGDAEVRIAELGVGAHELTLHIDHELLAVIEGDLGWSWLEADTSQGRIADNLFRMKLAPALKWLADEHTRNTRQLGIAIAREPGYTPDGQRLVADWRVDLAYGVETSAYSLAASGGISWPKTIAGGWAPTLPRYGSSLELMFKLGAGIEAGPYHATSYENQHAGDPWSASRTWSTEAGLLVRYRRGTSASKRVRTMCGRY